MDNFLDVGSKILKGFFTILLTILFLITMLFWCNFLIFEMTKTQSRPIVVEGPMKTDVYVIEKGFGFSPRLKHINPSE